MEEKISVVVCVKNEEKRIKECLDCIILNEPDEIIVVVGDSDDKTAEIAKRYTNKVIITKNSNLPRDRQIGINMAKNEFIAMIDGDHRLLRDDLKSLLADLKKYRFDMVQSGIKAFHNNNWMNKAEEQMWELNDNIPGPSKMIGAAPSIYKKSLFEKIQFDDTITKTIDDTDFAYRLSLLKDVRYGIGDTLISQLHTASYHDYFKKFKWYGIGDGEFCIKHRERAFSMWFHLFVRYPVIYPIKAIFHGKFWAAPYCFIQGIVRGSWMIITISKRIQKKG